MGGGTGQHMEGDCVILEMVAIDLMSKYFLSSVLQVCIVSLEPVMTSIFRISLS